MTLVARPATLQHVQSQHRLRAFDLFDALLTASAATTIETQSNDPLLSIMLHAHGSDITAESILFQDLVKTHHPAPGTIVRRAAPGDAAQITEQLLDPDADWVVELENRIVATGGVLFHCNRPYGDIFMKVAEDHRMRGIGTYLVQELKNACYQTGNIPSARCHVTNVASRKTLQRAGFAPCGTLLRATISG
jgi:GNAT superfamily N-acetyltransferase